MEQEESLIWPLVIVFVAYLFYKASQTSSAVTLAQAQEQAAAAAAANNNPWLAVSGGVGALGAVVSGFSNLFSSMD